MMKSNELWKREIGTKTVLKYFTLAILGILHFIILSNVYWTKSSSISLRQKIPNVCSLPLSVGSQVEAVPPVSSFQRVVDRQRELAREQDSTVKQKIILSDESRKAGNK